VGYVNARAGLLCALFCQLALLAMRRAVVERRAAWWGATLAAYALALASKETAGVLPLALLAYDRLLLDGDRRRLWRVHLPLVAATLLLGGARLWLLWRRQSGSPPNLAHVATQLWVFWRYLRLMVLPVGQSLMHEVPPVVSPRDWRPWASVAALLLSTVALVARRRRAPAPVFGALWWSLLLVPSAAVPLVEIMAEHRVYEASLGLFLAAGLLAGAALSARAIAGAVALVVALATATVARNRVWASPARLWRDAADKAPGLWGPHYALGDALREDGDCDGAVPEYRRAVALRPTEARIFMNLGICLAAVERNDEAAMALEQSRRLEPRNATTWYNLALVEADRGRLDRARYELGVAIGLDPKYAKARIRLVQIDPSERERQCAVLGPTVDECKPPR
jgi:Flp pilus assembly protein TadD